MTLTPGETVAGEPPVVPEVRSDGSGVAALSPWQIAWRRLRRDRFAMAGGVVVIVIVLAAILATPITNLVGVDPYTSYDDLLNPDTGLPEGRFGGVSWDHPFGIEPATGRDIFARIVFGARTSLVIAGLATVLTVVLGVGLGLVAGYVGGFTDTVIARSMDLMLAFPVLLFSVALLVTLQSVDSLAGLSGNVLRGALLVLIIGVFNWAYLGRVIRGQTLSLRTREFVEASRGLGAGRTRILVRELLPNLASTILVYATLTLPVNILNEAALSFLGVGVLPPTPSWGEMISSATSYIQVDPMYMLVPGLAIFVTVLAFNLLGDGLRDSLDPRSDR
jgi:ABC-type dipeptide/oligopeptide/nickel transport system permease subunit